MIRPTSNRGLNNNLWQMKFGLAGFTKAKFPGSQGYETSASDPTPEARHQALRRLCGGS
jgi:hypothetical protein